MDIEKLIEQLNNLEFVAYGYNINGEVLGMECTEFECLMVDAATALSALRPVSRERVEKVWRGEWLNFYNDFSTAECSKCGELFEVSPDETPKEEFFKAFSGFYHFCPACGAAQNDKDVEMVMERWKEAVVDEA